MDRICQSISINALGKWYTRFSLSQYNHDNYSLSLKILDNSLISLYYFYLEWNIDMETNYLDIYPSNSIAFQIEAEPIDNRWHDLLVANANAYIQIMENENLDYLESRKGSIISSGDSFNFLRCQERTHNTKLILQYLITFLSNGLPLEEDFKDDPANPFEQFKMFVYNNIELLKERDVSTAILKEHERLGLLNDTNAWYYRGQIDKSYKAMTELLKTAHKATLEDYFKILQALHKLCVFWFAVRNEEVHRVRKSDILTYKLVRFIMAKYPELHQTAK